MSRNCFWDSQKQKKLESVNQNSTNQIESFKNLAAQVSGTLLAHQTDQPTFSENIPQGFRKQGPSLPFPCLNFGWSKNKILLYVNNSTAYKKGGGGKWEIICQYSPCSSIV